MYVSIALALIVGIAGYKAYKRIKDLEEEITFLMRLCAKLAIKVATSTNPSDGAGGYKQ